MHASEEIGSKRKFIRQALQATGAARLRLRGTGWFAWPIAGGSNTVLLAAETGGAEILVTATAAWILTDEIEAQRIKDEQLPFLYDDYPHPQLLSQRARGAKPLFRFPLLPEAG